MKEDASREIGIEEVIDSHSVFGESVLLVLAECRTSIKGFVPLEFYPLMYRTLPEGYDKKYPGQEEKPTGKNIENIENIEQNQNTLIS